MRRPSALRRWSSRNRRRSWPGGWIPASIGRCGRRSTPGRDWPREDRTYDSCARRPWRPRTGSPASGWLRRLAQNDVPYPLGPRPEPVSPSLFTSPWASYSLLVEPGPPSTPTISSAVEGHWKSGYLICTSTGWPASSCPLCQDGLDVVWQGVFRVIVCPPWGGISSRRLIGIEMGLFADLRGLDHQELPRLPGRL